MISGAIDIFRWMLRFGFILSAVIMFITLLNIIISGVGVALNGSVIFDILYIIQMWAPFNLNPMLMWLSTTVTAYFAYKLYLYAFSFVNNVIRN